MRVILKPAKTWLPKPMKKNVLILISVLALGLSAARSQTLLNSWENSLEGWTISEPGIWSTTGFSTTTGVTAGTYSWNLTAVSGPDYGLALTGPSSTNLTTLLENAASISIDVLTPVAGSFGYYQQWDVEINQPGGAGTISLDGDTYDQSPSIGGPESTLTWTVPAAVRQALAGHPTLPVYLTFSIGGGGSGTMYVDNLRVTPLGLINSWENSEEGWTIEEPAIWSSGGFSTTTGVTAGLYSWELTAASGPNYNTAIAGPSSTNLTTLLANAASVSVDVDVPVGGSFGYYLQWDLSVNQPGGLGSVSVDDGQYTQAATIGGESTLTFAIPQSIRTALLSNPSLPSYLSYAIGGGSTAGAMTIYLDNLRASLLPPAPASLSVRELWDDLGNQEIPAEAPVTDDSSSVGFAPTPWIVNPSETNNCELMAFRPGFNSEGSILMGLPGSLDGTYGCMVQQNSGFNFVGGGNSFWTDGDFMTRQLTPANFINFQAVGEYWFTMTIGNSTASLDAQYVTFPASGAGGIGFADGTTTNSDFVAVGVTGFNVYFGPTNATYPFGATNASKAIYISQGTLGQPGNTNSTVYNPLTDPNANPVDSPPDYAPPYNSEYTQTNFTGGPYHINAFGAQTVGSVMGDGIVVLGHLKTFGDGTATLDAKYYTITGGNPWNYNLDTNGDDITWDCSYSFNFGGTMTSMLLFQNGQFPFYVYGFRASTNFSDVVGLDRGRIAVSPLTNTYVGYAINMTNLAVEASSSSFVSPPSGYGTLNYQWYQNGVAISGATDQYLNIASASLTDPNMPAGTDAGVYTSVATDPSGTWQPVTNSVAIAVTQLNPPALAGVQMLHNQNTFLVNFDEPNLTGADATNHYVFSDGVVVTGVIVVNTATTTEAQISTTTLPLGTKLTLTISGLTNVVGGTLASTNESLWTDLVQKGAANWDAWQCPAGEVDSAYYNTFVPATPSPLVLQSMALTSWEGPSSGVTILGLDGYVGDDFGNKLYGWFIPPVTTNYVFFVSADDGCRLSLSTNSSSTNLFVIACDGDWNGADQWTNISDTYPSSPHRGDGTATGVGPTGYVWDNSVAAQSPATACDQNRSDQFLVAYWDSSGVTGAVGEPAGATDQVNWESADAPVANNLPPGMTNFWPDVDANGQALINLQAGQMYYLQLEHNQNGGGYDESVTYKYAGDPDPHSPSSTILTGSNIAGTVPFTPTVSIAETNGRPVITYTGVLLAGTSLSGITNVVAQSSASTAISLGGPSQYSPPNTATNMFYLTSR
jgi:hypothetical protein